LQAIGKLEGLASDQMYTEQKWVTTYLKNIRNEADRQSTSLQVSKEMKWVVPARTPTAVHLYIFP